MEQRVIISRHLNTELTKALSECEHDRLFVLTDETTKNVCWPVMESFQVLKEAKMITIGATDQNKSLESVVHVWQELEVGGATRHSCMINLGGGMVTDLGGFAASTFKRGINFINIPTTLLAMVDASVGGKTGFNFNGLKNEIGVFHNANSVILDTVFLKTLDRANLCSGYAEMLKHGLISDEKHWSELVSFDLTDPDLDALSRMLADSVKVKQRVVTKDPFETGIRKALNFGHTIGHALEAFSLKNASRDEAWPLLHGYAVAYGLVCELYLSTVKMHFPTERMRQTVHFILENYGRPSFVCDDYDELIALMHHDKKNTGSKINFTLLSGIGKIHINQTATDEEIKEALDFLREG